MISTSQELQRPLLDLLLAMADDKLFLGHRNGDWTGLGPYLEEDIAFSNMAQDLIAHAQELYVLVARFADNEVNIIHEVNRLAYERPVHERRNSILVELPDDYDWAKAVVRQFFFAHFDILRLPRLIESSFPPLAELAVKMKQEVGFHLEYFDEWILKLGNGNNDSRNRVQAAIDALWAPTADLFEPVQDQVRLTQTGFYPGNDELMRGMWYRQVKGTFDQSGLQMPGELVPPAQSGRRGQHTEHLDGLLEELTEVYRCEPGASW